MKIDKLYLTLAAGVLSVVPAMAEPAPAAANAEPAADCSDPPR